MVHYKNWLRLLDQVISIFGKTYFTRPSMFFCRCIFQIFRVPPELWMLQKHNLDGIRVFLLFDCQDLTGFITLLVGHFSRGLKLFEKRALLEDWSCMLVLGGQFILCHFMNFGSFACLNLLRQVLRDCQ